MRLTKVITFGDGCIVMDNSVGIDFHISSCGNRRSVGDNNHNPQDQCNVFDGLGDGSYHDANDADDDNVKEEDGEDERVGENYFWINAAMIIPVFVIDNNVFMVM